MNACNCLLSLSSGKSKIVCTLSGSAESLSGVNMCPSMSKRLVKDWQLLSSAKKSNCLFCLRRRGCQLRHSASQKGTPRILSLHHADCASVAPITLDLAYTLPDTFSPLAGLWTYRVSSGPFGFLSSRTCLPHPTVPPLSFIHPLFTPLPPLTSLSTSSTLYLCFAPWHPRAPYPATGSLAHLPGPLAPWSPL